MCSKRFSRRTAKIEKLAQEKGIIDPEEKAKLGKKTREHKNPTLRGKICAGNGAIV